MRISVSMIVHDEEANIAEVCSGLSWADEIVIVDSDSTDRTVELAGAFTDKIFNREFSGYKDKHQFADSQTTGDWIFWIDADERVTPELRGSIEYLRNLPDAELADGYKIARKTMFMHRWIRHSGWYPDFQMRLYRKEKSFWDGVAPHETARVEGRVQTLNGEFLHFTKQNLSEYHRVTDFYATLAAEHKFGQGETVGGFGIFANSIAAFLRSFIFKQGFRDGVPGLMIGMFTAYGVFLKYAKLWEHNHKKK